MSQFYIPYFRTFNEKNGQTRETKTILETTNEEGVVEKTEVIGTVPEEKVLGYLPNGNYKWCVDSPLRTLQAVLIDPFSDRASFEVDTTDAQKPTVSIEVTIDGAKAWECVPGVLPPFFSFFHSLTAAFSQIHNYREACPLFWWDCAWFPNCGHPGRWAEGRAWVAWKADADLWLNN